MAGKGRSLNEMLKRGGYNSNNIAVTGHGDEEDYIDGLPPALQEASAPVLQRVKVLLHFFFLLFINMFI
jgi:hypothetical protein